MWENHKWRLIFIALPCCTPVPPPFLSSLLNHQYHCPPSPHMWSDLSCATKVLLETQLKKISPANITPQGHKASCYCALQVSILQVPRAAPMQKPRDPHPSARHLQQPLPFPGNSQCYFLDPQPTVIHNFTASASFRLQNEENPTPQCKVCPCFPIVWFSAGELKSHKSFSCTSRSKRWADLAHCSMLVLFSIGIP